MLNNIRVAHRVWLITTLVTTALIALLLLSFSFFSVLGTQLTLVRDLGMPNALTAKDMQMQVVQVQQWLTDISATRALDGLSDGYQEAEKAYQLFGSDLAKLRSAYQVAGDSRGLAAADLLKQRMDTWYESGKRMAAAYIKDGTESGNRIMLEFDTISTQLQQALEPVISGQLDGANQALDLALESADRMRLWILLGLLSVIGIAGGGGMLLIRGVVVRLGRISQDLQTIVRKRDLSTSIPVDGNDEITWVGRAFNEVITTLRQMLSEMGTDVVKLDDTVGTLSAAITQASASSETSSESAASMAAAAEELAANLHRMRDSAESTLLVVREASRYSDQGGEVIDRAVLEMQKISASILQVSAVITELGDHTGRISNIVEVIKAVADQTNLLALNAAIEAARAGDAGRGFAVVADEVRKLADRTSQSTAEIGAMIQAIQTSSQHAIGTMEESVRLANSGAGLAESAGAAIGNIRASTGQVERVFSDITLAITEQSHTGQVIALKVESVAQAADQSLAATRQSAQAASALAGMANDIRRFTAKFGT